MSRTVPASGGTTVKAQSNFQPIHIHTNAVACALRRPRPRPRFSAVFINFSLAGADIRPARALALSPIDTSKWTLCVPDGRWNWLTLKAAYRRFEKLTEDFGHSDPFVDEAPVKLLRPGYPVRRMPTLDR